ncbi:MAG TPA: phosphatase PAP2 family protein [Streptosporangiaceae bacterium]
MVVEASPAVSRDRRGRGRLSLRREIGLGLLLFACYGLATALPLGGRRAAARHHGRALYHLEGALHIAVERPLNRWLAGHPVLAVIADYEYASVYVISTLVLFCWLFLRRPDRFPAARSSFALITLLGVACFTVWPAMPPRLLPHLNFVDTVRSGHTWGSWGSPLVDHADQLAAMPSLHVAWALWVAVELGRLSAGRILRGVSVAHVVVTVLVIVVTGNHYLLDAAGACLIVWISVSLVERRRPFRLFLRHRTRSVTVSQIHCPVHESHGVAREGGSVSTCHSVVKGGVTDVGSSCCRHEPASRHRRDARPL